VSVWFLFFFPKTTGTVAWMRAGGFNFPSSFTSVTVALGGARGVINYFGQRSITICSWYN